MPRATIFGAGGFVGTHLAKHLAERGWRVAAVARGAEPEVGADLGHVFYCIGLTADFRTQPFATVESHVSKLAAVLERYRFATFAYLSSTRVYARATDTNETAAIPVMAHVPDDLYNISKLMGEALCLSCGKPGVQVARLSNVFGADQASSNFLSSVLREAVTTGRLELRTSWQSNKDYVAVTDVVRALEAMALAGSDPIVNVAAGCNTSHGEIVDQLRRIMPLDVTVQSNAPTVGFPSINTTRLDALQPGKREHVLDALPRLVSALSS